jgi:chitin synthase
MFTTGLLFDQDISLNKRSDSGERIMRVDIHAIDGKLQEEEQDSTISSKDRVTRIKGCATMWHENSAEMCEMMKSFFRMDEDYCAR